MAEGNVTCGNFLLAVFFFFNDSSRSMLEPLP